MSPPSTDIPSQPSPVDSGAASVAPGFVTRVASLPVVHSTMGAVKVYYDGTKQRFGVVEKVEQGLVSNFVPHVLNIASAPAVSHRLAQLDQLACHGLDSLEKKVPIITEPTEKVLENGRTFVQERIYQPVMSGAEAVDQLLERALLFSEETLNQVLPALDDETTAPQEQEQDQNDDIPETEPRAAKRQKLESLARAQHLGSTITRRISSRALKQVAALKQINPQEIQRIVSIDTIHFASEAIEKQISAIRATIQEGNIIKHLDHHFIELRNQLNLAIERAEKMTPTNVKETTQTLLLSLSKNLSEFAEGLTQAANKALDIKSMTPALQSSLNLLKAYADSLSKLAHAAFLPAKKEVEPVEMAEVSGVKDS